MRISDWSSDVCSSDPAARSDQSLVAACTDSSISGAAEDGTEAGAGAPGSEAFAEPNLAATDCWVTGVVPTARVGATPRGKAGNHTRPSAPTCGASEGVAIDRAPGWGPCAMAEMIAEGSGWPDRKSTRLNSSH